jgi:TatD DNase family protein
MRLIDTHNHLDFPPFDEDRAAVLQRSRALGVTRQVLIGVYHAHWERLWRLVEAEDGLHAALGLHPCFLDHHRPEHLAGLRERLEALAGQPKLCAIGEVGLDYYIERPDKPAQQALFEAQIGLAKEFGLPLLLHVRRAHADVIATLKRFRPARGGIAHAFSGSYEEAREYLRLGFRIGLGGAGTWPQALRMQRVLKQLPLEGIVLETDAPDIAPASHPGQRNSPEFLPDICRALAALRGIPAEELAAASTANAETLFGWRS